MIARFTSEMLRQMANQLDAHTALEAAGADHLPPNTLLTIDGSKMAYLHWWNDGEQWMAEILSFTPGSAEPLIWNADDEPSP